MRKSVTKDVAVSLMILFLCVPLTYCKNRYSGKEIDFTVIYSNDVWGEVEPCG